MSNFELANRIKMLKKYSNIDALYGPYTTLSEARNLIEESIIDTGFTIGVLDFEEDNSGDYVLSNVLNSQTNEEYPIYITYTGGNVTRYKISGVSEYWYINNNWEEKIEKYELRLDRFSVTKNEQGIIINYRISGKGLMPRVTITGTSVQGALRSFDTDYLEIVVPKNPGKYVFKITVSDSIGTKFVIGEAGTDTVEISWGSILVESDLSRLEGLTPIEFNTSRTLALKLRVNYSDVVSNVNLYLNDSNTVLKSNILSGFNDWISLVGYTFASGTNTIYLTYFDNEQNQTITYLVYSFNVLNYGEFGILLSKVPDAGYLNTNLIFLLMILYGGHDPNSQETEVYLKDVKISLIKNNLTRDYGIRTGSVNSNTIVQYEIPDNFETGEYILKVELVDDDTIFQTKLLRINELSSDPNPYGFIRFNSNVNNVTPLRVNSTNTLFIHETFPTSANTSWNWRSDEPQIVLTSYDNQFNFDICYTTPQDGTNDTLITIRDTNNTKVLKINKLSIVSTKTDPVKGSTIFFIEDEELLKEVYIPSDGQVHIGYGCNREIPLENPTSQHQYDYYDCVFINGEIVYSTPRRTSVTGGSTVIEFSNSLVITEFCFSQKTGNHAYSDCVNISGEKALEYILSEGSSFDVFYYNWKTTLTLALPDNNSLTEFKLIPFVEGDLNSQDFWNDFKTSGIGTKSNPGPLYVKPINKLVNFITFGPIRRDEKPGVTIGEPLLFNFNVPDKEIYKRDKEYAVICKYRLGNYGEEDLEGYKKLCIVLIQGTSTITYPVPNFLFTFIKYKLVNGEYEFALDNTIPIIYSKPDLNQDIDDNFINEETVEGEINLVAKADSMDSSHLNNTPTCIYLNALIDALDNDNSNKYFLNGSERFGHNNINYYNAIVGSPIVVKISEVERNNFSDSEDFNQAFRSIGTFMFNIGKSARAMGMDEEDSSYGENIYSLEGQSNEKDLRGGSPGLFMLPQSAESLLEEIDNIEAVTQEETDVKNSLILAKSVREAFDELGIDFTENNIILTGESNLTDAQKALISKFLINSNSFESRNNRMDDDDLVITDEYDSKLSQKWNRLKPFLTMWLFVNQATDNYYETVNGEEILHHGTFYNYFEKVFNLDYAIIYYIHLLLFGQVDNLGKNMMLDMNNNNDANNLGKWYIRPYDLDSLLGLSNTGYEMIPVYACISADHFKERYGLNGIPAGLYYDTFNVYNSYQSILWTKFWKNFLNEIRSYYANLREKYVTPEKIIKIELTLVNDIISKELYNIDFYIKYYDTEYMYLSKGGRFNNFKEWLRRRFMYVDSYFSYFTFSVPSQNGMEGYYFRMGPTLVPTFYEAGYALKTRTYYGQLDYSNYDEETGTGSHIGPEAMHLGRFYALYAVPEAILYLSPLWGDFSAKLRNYTNILNYTGVYDATVVNIIKENLKNVRTIEFISGTVENVESLEIPSSVETLILRNMQFSAPLSIDYLTSNLLELLIDGCTFSSSLTFSDLKLLKKLIIKNSVFTELQLTDLNLDELSIDLNTKINILTLGGTLTSNGVLNLSGINTKSNNDLIILFTKESSLREIYLDLVYNLDGSYHTVYDNYTRVSDNTSDRANNNVYNSLIDGKPISITSLNGAVFLRLIPKISTLDLSLCSELETFSAIGSNLQTLTLPTSVKKLNLQFCKQLDKLNYTEGSVTDTTTDTTYQSNFNFEGFTDLESKPFFVFGRTHSSEDVRNNYKGIYWMCLFEISLRSFNLIGCDNVKEIRNLTSVGSSFTGRFLVSGCRNLLNFTGCDIILSDLRRSFALTEKLLNIAIGNMLSAGTQFKINPSSWGSLENGEGISYAFMDSLIAKGNLFTTLLTLLGSLSVNAAYVFAGSPLYNNIGTTSNPITLNWTSSEGSFGGPVYTTISNNGYEYETFCVSGHNYSSLFESSSRRPSGVKVYIKLPNTTSVVRMFLNQHIDLNPDVFIKPNNLSSNTSINNAYGFLGGTEQSLLIRFNGCSSLRNVGYCYSNTNVGQYIQDHFNELSFDILLPSNVTNLSGLFASVNLENVDVKGFFKNLNRHLTSSMLFNRCFGNTKCNCSGSPFGDNFNPTGTVDISGMFSLTEDFPIGEISNYSWIKDGMITSNLGALAANSMPIGNIGGVFLGKILQNFPQSIANNGDSLVNMFKNAKIESLEGESNYYAPDDVGFDEETRFIFTASSKDCSSIFEGIKLEIPNHSNYQLAIDIAPTVTTLSKGFLDTNSVVRIKFLGLTSGIKNLDWAFGVSKLDNLGNSPVACAYVIELEYANNLINLTSAAHIFLNSRITADVNPNIAVMFRGCRNLTNFRGAFKNCKLYTNKATQSEILDLRSCTQLVTLEEAFCGSGILLLPLLPTLNYLTSLTRTFREINLAPDELPEITISSSSLKSITETFAKSSVTGYLVNISLLMPNLLTIEAFSTHLSISVNIESNIANIYSRQPLNLTGGTLTVSGDNRANLYFNNGGNTGENDSGWNVISTSRNTSVSQSLTAYPLKATVESDT